MNDAEQIADEIINEKSRHIATLVKALWKIIQVWPEGEDVRYENSIEHIAQTALGRIKATTEGSKGVKCHKCKKEMTMTPVCTNCGVIPITEASFKIRDQRIARLEKALTEIKENSYDDGAVYIAEEALGIK